MKVILLHFFLCWLPMVNGCPFETYEEGLLTNLNPIQIITRQLSHGEGESVGMGFWSFCIPVWNVLQYPVVESPFLSSSIEDGQLLLLLSSLETSQQIFLDYLKLDEPNLQIWHQIILGKEEKFQDESFYYEPLTYEGKWIFTLITLIPSQNTIQVQLTDQIKRTYFFDFSELNNIQITIGGRGVITINKTAYNLNIFRGRLSKLIQQTLNFEDFSNFCKIPPKVRGIQTTNIVQGLRYFNGDTILSFNIDQVGSRFCLQGWVKFDDSKIISSLNQTLFLLTTFLNYENFAHYGDVVLKYFVILNKAHLEYTQSVILNSLYTIPAQGYVDFFSWDTYSQFFFFGQSPEFPLFQQVTSWHYFQYEYGNSRDKALLQMQFFNPPKVLTNSFGSQTRQGSFINTKYYLFFGGDDFSYTKLFAFISDFKFTYNYNEDRTFLIEICHYSCNTCNGPLINNCLDCSADSHRLFLSDSGLCKCQYGFIDQQGEMICQSFQTEFSSVIIQESSNSDYYSCKMGYFQLPLANGTFSCLICPQLNIDDHLCVDCLYHQQTWYQQPYCTIDLNRIVSSTDGVYSQIQRNIIDYDVYYIDDTNSVVLIEGVFGFCNDLAQFNCYNSSLLHLGQQINIMCKPNYYFDGQKCIKSDPFCIKVNQNKCTQCIQSMYLKNSQCYQCPENCQTCEQNGLTLLCLTCQPRYALSNGLCKECGSYCLICSDFFDQILNNSYLKCFKCIDNKKYLLSLDGVNCLENTIYLCLYAFQTLSSDLTVNTLDYYFTPQIDSDDVITQCALCELEYTLVIPNQACVFGSPIGCYFSFSNDPNFIHYYESSENWGICLISDEKKLTNSDNIVQFSKGCVSESQNCDACLLGKNSEFYTCLICSQGFYSDRITEKCLSCPVELNCLQCIQQDSKKKDDWKVNIRAFYRAFMTGSQSHPYTLFGQSQNAEDYEIVCSSCLFGYDLVDYTCIKSCPTSCLECQLINGVNTCIKCPLDLQGRRLSLIDNQCVQCQKNCALCRSRSSQEITALNPLFNNSNLIYFSYHCLQSFNDQDYYYDQQIGQYIQCDNNDEGCQYTFIIPINLYCSLENYNQQLDQLINEQEIIKFKQQNIFIQDLFSGQSFSQFYNNEFYIQTNQRQIKTIILKIAGTEEQICVLSGDQIIEQSFSTNIFEAINIELELNFEKRTVFQFDGRILFFNFKKVSIHGITFQHQSNNNLKQIIFQSAFPQIISLNSVIFTQAAAQTDQLQIVFNDVKNLKINNLTIINIIQSEPNQFFIIRGTNYGKQISLNQIFIQNCLFYNQLLFYFIMNQNDTIIFENVNIEAQFYNSSLISQQSSIQIASINLSSFTFNIKAINCFPLINFSLLNDVQASSWQIFNSSFSNSTFILLGQEGNLTDIKIQSSYILQLSRTIINQNLQSTQPYNFKLEQIIFQDNEYDQTIKFIKFEEYNSKGSIIKINSLILQGNYVDKISKNFNIQQEDSALCYFQFSYIQINSLNLERGYGLPEFSFINATELIITEATLTLQEKYRFLGLHQYLDCQLKQINGKYYSSSILIYQIQFIVIDNLVINQLELYDQPLINIISSDLTLVKEDESIFISNIFMKQNLLLITKEISKTALISISTQQQITIIIQNAKFEKNILNEYVKNDQIESAALLYIDCLLGSVFIQQSQFLQNFVTNNSDSIMIINSNFITIVDCIFQGNSIFYYDIIQPYLLWGFDNSESVSLNKIKIIFPIQSISGNGYLIGQSISIVNCTLTNSSGYKGGGFFIQTQNNAFILIKDVIFNNINTYFNSLDDSGGALYIDGSKASSLDFTLANIQVSKINCRYQGGLLYFIGGLKKILFKIENIVAYDIFSQIGSLFFINLSNLASQSQIMSIRNIQMFNSILSYIGFLEKFRNIQDSEYSTLINNRSLIYISNGYSLSLQNITVTNLFFEQLLNIRYIQKVFISGVRISNCTLSNNLIYIAANQVISSYSAIQQLFVTEISVGKNIATHELCFDNTSYIIQKNFQCLPHSQTAPISLIEQNQNNLDSGYCLLNKIYKKLDLAQSGLIIIQDLFEQSQFKLTNIFLNKIDCKKCQYGLLMFIFIKNSQLSSRIDELKIINNQCGRQGCLIVKSSETTRVLQDSNLYQDQFQLIVTNYQCLKNTATIGTCLMIENMSTLVKASDFKGNIASQSGGALLAKGTKQFILSSCNIIENIANVGGGVSQDQLAQNYTILHTTIQDNKANFYGNDAVSPPSKLTIRQNSKDNLQNTINLIRNQSICIDQVIINPYEVFKNQTTNYLYLPSGQLIYEYQYFDWKSFSYVPLYQSLGLVALNQDLTIQQNLTGSYCNIISRIINITTNETISQTNNLRNQQHIDYNETTEDYNLDYLKINFDPDSSPELVLQLEFQCNVIQVPIYNEQYPNNVVGYHSNYFLRLNVRTFPCQLGEIKQNSSCILCQSDQGLFSLKLNALKCEILDDVTTISIKPAQLNLKQGYWRPYLDTSQISSCFNLKENCQGGWIHGDTSCFTGHIGALCEQCDIYDIRGNGSFSKGPLSTNYSCGTCENISKNAILIGAITIWTVISVLISVTSTLKAIEQSAKILGLGLAVNIDKAKSAILIKMLINYFQILATLTTFQLQITWGMANTLNAAGNPIQTVAYSLDCLLINIFNFDIQYSRMVWQLILPLIYIIIFFTFYLIGVKLKIVMYNGSVITTTFLYMYINLQPNIIGGFVQLISYRDISGFQWIQANVAFRYDTMIHFKWMLSFCLPTLLLIGLFIPFFMLNNLYLNRNHLDEKHTRLKWGYLYNEYKKTAYFWEIIKIVVKELIIIFVTYYSDTIVLKGILILGIVYLYYELNILHEPYQYRLLNKLDQQSSKICFVSIGLGIGIYVSQQQLITEIQIPFYISLALINIYFFLLLISKIVFAYLKESSYSHEEQLDRLRDIIKEQFPQLLRISFFRKALRNRKTQRIRVAHLFKKLKNFLIPQAKNIIAFKNYQWQAAQVDITDSNSQRFVTENQEKFRLLMNTLKQTSLNQSKQNFALFLQDRVTRGLSYLKQVLKGISIKVHQFESEVYENIH